MNTEKYVNYSWNSKQMLMPSTKLVELLSGLPRLWDMPEFANCSCSGERMLITLTAKGELYSQLLQLRYVSKRHINMLQFENTFRNTE